MPIKKLFKSIRPWNKLNREQYTHDITDQNDRKQSRFYTRWIDHEILRLRWHNFHEISPNIYRSNHPTHERFEMYASMGIKTILNLRGATHHCHYKFEFESCKNLGLDLINISLSARKAPSRETMLHVLDILRSLETPTLIHCKSGADRTGLVSAIYLMAIKGQKVETAKKQLSIRFFHLKFTQTGILDYILSKYENRIKSQYISFNEWVYSEYNAEEIKCEYRNLPIWKRLYL